MGSRAMEGDWDASGAKTTKPAKTGTALPAACSSGEAFLMTGAAGGQNLYLCKPDNAWTLASGGAIAGKTDQARVSNSIRSADWIKTEYNNRNTPGAIGAAAFWTFGARTALAIARRRTVMVQ
jgi:hypothetical protein